MNQLIHKSLKRLTAVIAALTIISFPLAGLIQLDWLNAFLRQFVTFYLTVVSVRMAFFFYGAFRQRIESSRLDKTLGTTPHQPLVSLIAPMYNEVDVVEASLTSIIEIDYPFLEVIVVDDGSLDKTALSANLMASLSARHEVKVVTQANRGKAAALNTGLMQATGEVIMCVDADSKINKDAITKGLRYLRDPEVGAVAGFIEIANQNNMLTLLQELEYLVGLNFTRRALSYMGVVPIVPGPAGMFRRKALVEAGGFRTDREIFAEDAELSLRILANGWKIKAEEEMVAVTQAPDQIMPLLRQRYRWNRGTYQALLANMYGLFGSGFRGKWLALYLFTETTVTPIINFSLILYFVTHFFTVGELNLFTT